MLQNMSKIIYGQKSLFLVDLQSNKVNFKNQ